MTTEVKIAQRGLIAIPKELRDRYGMKAGDALEILDLGGVFVLSPRRGEVDVIADRLAIEWGKAGETLETMVTAIRQERAAYGK